MGCTRAVASLRALVLSIIVVVVAAACTSQAPPSAESVGSTQEGVTTSLTLYPTGVDALGITQVLIGLTDVHYSITADTDGARPAPRAAITTNPNAGWAATGTTGRWLSLDSNQCTGCVVATYDYTTTFTMPASANPLTASITAAVAADDSFVVLLNNTQVVNSAVGFASTTNITIGPAQAAFTTGTNTLTFRVSNSGGGPTGLYVKSISGSASDCTSDSMCTSTQFCDTGSNSCTAKLANGTAIPTIPSHTSPTLNGTCTAAAGTAVCASGVCDPVDNKCGLLNNDGPCTDGTACRSAVCDSDNKCGYANGDGPCTLLNGGTVCRSGACAVGSGRCVPTGGTGCAADIDCAIGSYCNGSTFTCAAKLSNGSPLVAPDPLHNNGVCSGNANGQCQSGFCDSDNKCGIADNDTCSGLGGSASCRSGVCGIVSGVCVPTGGCAVDGDCDTTTQFCNTPLHQCATKLANGSLIPIILGHTPTIDGTCNATTGSIVCTAGVCDPNGNVCGLNPGDGTCTATSQCTSGVCVTTGANAGKCEPCTSDGNCSGLTPACNTTTNQCVACTATNPGQCTGITPVCNTTSNGCVGCNGDNGTSATQACPTSTNPYCGILGNCAKCTVNLDCTVGSHAGSVCNTTTGACGNACTGDADCAANQWCNNPTNAAFAGTCAAKIANGQPVPAGAPINGTCTAAVGTRVCVSGVCSTTDNLCGAANGTACTSAATCRSGVCNADGSCGDPNGTACTSASTCRSGICDATDGKCGLGNGEGPCTTGSQCRSGTCTGGTCAGGDAGVPDGGGDSGVKDGGDGGGSDGSADGSTDASGPDASDGSIGDGSTDDGSSPEDASSDGAPTSDGSTSDASHDATADGSDGSNSDAGDLSGGGCDCRTSSTKGGASDTPWASVGLAVLGLALVRRRAGGKGR